MPGKPQSSVLSEISDEWVTERASMNKEDR